MAGWPEMKLHFLLLIVSLGVISRKIAALLRLWVFFL